MESLNNRGDNMGLKDNKLIYAIGHRLNLFRLKFRFIPYSFKYFFADRKPKLHINDRNSTEKYLIFQRVDFTGLMTHVFLVMGWIKYSLENDYILLVDTSKGNNPYLENDENTWEVYYKQPMLNEKVDKTFIERIMKEENYSYVPYSTRHGFRYSRSVPRWLTKVFKPKVLFPQDIDFCKDEESLKYWEALYHQYIFFQSGIKKYIEDEFQRVIGSHGKILGVLIRGAGYRKAKPYMHHIQPEMDSLIKKIDEFKENYQWDYIYLATEEEKYEELLKKQYPGMILTNKRTYDKDSPERHGHQAGLEYLSSMHILSKCNMLIAGLCGGSQAAVLMNQHQYEHVYLFDIGKYQ